MADFTKAFKITIIGNEGGYDPGVNEAETYRGIDRSKNPGWAGWKLIDSLKKANSTVHAMNQALAANEILQTNIQHFYKTNYWDTIKLDQVKDQQLANNLFDGSVNPCLEPVAKVMQQACNEVKQGAVTVDGVVGPATIACINALPAKSVFEAVNAIREGNYRQEVELHPKQKVWLKTWLKRLIAYI